MRLLLAATVLCLLAAPASADIDLKLSGWVSSDIRYRVAGADPRDPPITPTQWTLRNNAWSRNENRVRAALSIGLGSKVKAVADTELMMFGFSDLRDLDSTTLRDRVDPYYFEMHAAYVDINNLIKGLDLRIGRQVVPWGAADKFNPVSNLNTLDLSDPLLFGRALANNMVRADYTPISDLTFTAVVVPVFRPAQLPRTAPLALLDPLRPPPIVDEAVARALDEGRQIYLVNRPECQDQLRRFQPECNPLTVDVSVLQPEISGANTQFAFRAAYKILGQDVALSYYRGRFGVPVPAWSLLTGTLSRSVARTALMYPRVDIVGLEMAGSIERLGGLGYWAEAALNIPEEVRLGLYEEVLSGQLRAIEYVQMGDMASPNFVPFGSRPALRPVVIPRVPFVKATIGADYSIGSHVYLNFQYVHGFIDEFGAGRAPRPRRDPKDVSEQPRWETRVGDYLVGGMDVKVLGDRLLMRLFGVFKLPSVDLLTGRWDDWAPTGVLFPQIIWTVWDATELTVGAFLLMGDRSTKFGEPAAGGMELFAKARVSF